MFTQAHPGGAGGGKWHGPGLGGSVGDSGPLLAQMQGANTSSSMPLNVILPILWQDRALTPREPTPRPTSHYSHTPAPAPSSAVYQVAQMKNLNALPFVGAVSGGWSSQQTHQPANLSISLENLDRDLLSSPWRI